MGLGCADALAPPDASGIAVVDLADDALRDSLDAAVVTDSAPNGHSFA